MKRLSSIKEMTKIEFFIFFNFFSRIWKTGIKYRADQMGKRAEPWPTPTLILKNGEEKLFQKYLVFLPTR